MALPFLVLYLTRDLKFTTAQAGLGRGSYGAAACVSALLAGLVFVVALSRAPIHRALPAVGPDGPVVLPTRRAYSDPKLLFFVAAAFPVAVVFFQHISSMALYLVRDLHLSPIDYGLFFTINTLLIVALEVPINSATAHWPHRRTLALGAFLSGAGFGALA